MKRKGLFETIALAVVTLMLVGVFSVLGTKFLVDIEQLVRRETVDLAADRVSTSIYAANSLEKANQQINFPDEYNIHKTDKDDDGTEELVVSFTYNEKTKSAIIDSAEWIRPFSTTSELDNPDRESYNFCFTKRPNFARLDVGKCN